MRLMASGIDIKNCPSHLLSGLIQTQLDNDLSEYYKLLAILFALGKDFGKAQEYVNKFAGILLPEMGDADAAHRTKVDKLLEDMDKWVLEIDKSSLPKPKGRILRKKPLDTKPKKRAR
jgi:hypothetical protein